jgi:hypothetical protein
MLNGLAETSKVALWQILYRKRHGIWDDEIMEDLLKHEEKKYACNSWENKLIIIPYSSY